MPEKPSQTGNRALLRVGLTGGIASGKSHILRRLGELGATTIDADQVARQLVEPGQPALEKIADEFGREMLTPRGELDRSRLGSIVFSDPASRERLNRILHPPILSTIQDRVGRISSSLQPGDNRIVVVDAALMIEVGSYRNYDLIVVTYCPPEDQIRRLMDRDRLTVAEARRRLESQMPIMRKLTYADWVLSTCEDQQKTREQVDYLFQEWSFLIERGEWPALLRRKRYRHE